MRARKTRQFDAIEQALRSAARPLAMAELHAAALENFPGLGIATVYRTVRELSEDGRIVSVAYAGQPTRFEWAVARQHSHFICHRCSRVYDIESPQGVPLPKNKPKGFKFTGNEVIYYGMCADCAAPVKKRRLVRR